MSILQTANPRKGAIIALLLTALLWSTGGLAFRLLTISNGLAISGYRSFFAALFFIAVFKTLPKMENTRWFKLGILAHCGATTFFVIANTMTTAANAVVLQYTAPIFVCIYVFLITKKPLPARDIIAVILIFSGICIFLVDSLTLQANITMTVGNIVAVFSGASFGMQAVVLRQTSVPRNVFIFGSGLNLILAIPFILQNPISSLFDLGILVYLGTIQVGFAYLLLSFAVPKVSPLELLLIPALEPILSPIWVFIFDGQRPSLLSIFGGIVIIATIIIWSLKKGKIGDKNQIKT